jgi:hypothetical protein
MDIDLSDLLVGVMMIALGLLGLLVASHAQDIEMYIFGLTLAGFAVLFVFGLIRRHFDREEEARAAMVRVKSDV